MKSKQNEIQLLFGVLINPLRIGRPAVVVHKGGWVATSPVQAITTLTKAYVEFETENSAYCVVPYRHPETSVASAMPAAA